MEVLTYPNITFARNLEADSYIVLLGAILRRLAVSRPDLRFTVLVPQDVESLRLPNVTQVEWSLPTYPNAMRCHFDVPRFLEIVDWKNRSWDVVWSHLPEHTTQVRNVFLNSTDERPPIVGYCHWFEVPEVHVMAADTLDLNFAGIAQMEFCGVNSRWLKDLVLERAAERVSVERIAALRRIIHPQYLGTDAGNAHLHPGGGVPGQLVFNHRANAYTGYDATVAACDELWKRRQDFTVWFSTAAAPDRPWAKKLIARDRDEYLGALSSMWAGIGAFQGYSAWSLSVTDGFSVGVPYVLPDRYCYPEMVGDGYPLLYAPGQLDLVIERVLDSPDLRAQAAAHGASAVPTWDKAVGSYERMFDWAAGRAPRIGPRSKKYDVVRPLAEAGATKAELKRALGWGIGIPWTPYRNRLRDDGVPMTGTEYGTKVLHTEDV